jgi:hypothetical protein
MFPTVYSVQYTVHGTLIENPSLLGVGGGLESVDTMEPMGMLDNMFAQQKPESVLGNFSILHFISFCIFYAE